MPFYKQSEAPDLFSINKRDTDFEAPERTGVGETVGALFALGNPVTAAVLNDNTYHIFDEIDPDYDPSLDYGEFTEYRDILASAKNKEHMEALKGDIKRKQYYERQIQQAGPKALPLGLAVGIVDPFNALPLGYATKVAKTGHLVQKLNPLQKTLSVAKHGAAGAGIAATSAAMSEAALQVTAPATTTEESANVLLMSGMLGGILGGAARMLRPDQYKELSGRMQSDFNKPYNQTVSDDAVIKAYNSTAGAKEVDKLTLDQLSFVSTFGMAKLSRYLTPTLRVMQSASVEARNAYSKLSEIPLKLKGAEDGVAVPVAVESRMVDYDTYLRDAYNIRDKAYQNHVADTLKTKRLSRPELKKRTAQALRRNDTDIQNDSNITKAAQDIRAKFFEPIKKRAIEVGLFPDDIEPKFADSYLSRLWDSQQIVSRSNEFKARLLPWAEGKVNRYIERIKEEQRQIDVKLQKDIRNLEKKIDDTKDKTKTKQNLNQKAKQLKEAAENKKANLQSEIAVLYDENGVTTTGYAKEIVDSVFDTFTQPQTKIPSFIIPDIRGPLKGKTLDVKDVDFEDFLVNDIDQILDYYARSMGAQIEMKRAFGNVTMKEQIDAITREYGELIDAAKTDKEKRALRKERDNVIRDIEGVRDIHLRQFNENNPDSLMTQSEIAMRDINYMSSLGGVAISSFPDVFRHIMVDGVSKFVDTAKLAGFSKELKKMTMDELKEYGDFSERVLSTRLDTLAEIGDPMNRGTALTRFTGNASALFSKVTLINYWNDMQKAFARMSTQKRFFDSLDGKDTAYMRHMGFDESAERIFKEQVKKHGKTIDGYRLTGIDKWDDTLAVQNVKKKYTASLKKEVDTKIVTSGYGDLPLSARKRGVRLFYQFRSFLISSHTRVFLRALQSRGSSEVAGAVTGAIAMISMGMMVAAIKAEMYRRSQGLRGKDASHFDPSQWTTAKWLYEGVDRSGLIALALEPLNISDKVGGVGPSMLTGSIPSRMASRSAVGAIFGPSVGTITDMANTYSVLTSPVTGRPVSSGDIYAIRRNLPFQNAFVFRQMFDILENKTAKALGAE